MFNLDAYLYKIGYDGDRKPTLENLRRLQKLHLMSIPFDNTLNAERSRGYEVLNDVDIDVDGIFEELVVNGRGGVCYETNGLFRRMLGELGYEVYILGAGVIQVNHAFGPDLEHIFNTVVIDGEHWIADVGLAGPTFLEPLRIVLDEVQTQLGCDYRIVDSEGYHLVQRRPKGADWSPIYRFHLKYRDIGEWAALIPQLADFPVEVALVGTRIHSRAFDEGQWVLIGRRFLTITNGEESVRVLARTDAYVEVVQQILERPKVA
jgi:amide synthase